MTAWDRREGPRDELAGRATIADPLAIDLAGFDGVVVTPGVPLNTHPITAKARAYLEHPVLGPRLRACAAALLATTGRSAEEILGSIDAVKVRSSMTLFLQAAPDEPLFRQVLDRFYDGRADDATDTILGGDRQA